MHLLLIFSISKQISNGLLCFSNKFAQNFRSIHNLRLEKNGIKHVRVLTDTHVALYVESTICEIN
jgi:hypothetical protein